MHVAWRAAMVVPVLVLSACAGGTSTREQSAGTPSDSASTSGPSSTTATAAPPSTTPTARADDLARLAASAQAAVSSLPTSNPTSDPTASTATGATIEGADVSWPQCPKGMGIPERRTLGSPMPLDSARFVLFGLTNGPGNTSNPCLADQVAWARARHLAVAAYSVISWPSADQLRTHGSPAKAGYAQAMANIATLKAAGLTTPSIWLDVEPVPDFDWPSGAGALAKNAAVVRAAAQAYADQGFQVGVYSTTALWRRVVGDLSLGLREWRAAGHTSRAEALVRCGPERSIQGGTAVLTQWVEAGRDRNVTCPGEAASVALWFHQY
ncbi:hypothetical protein [Nocardioides sp.]|uniref:hypothetical protein n=1 Tax=Nocardioides sp. TaxID=35761 RepID=UPI00260BB455|nr:hypothetical protein [Nocardioides sp.]